MVSLGFATCLQELLSDHRARSFLEHREKLLNYFHLRNLSKRAHFKKGHILNSV